MWGNNVQMSDFELSKYVVMCMVCELARNTSVTEEYVSKKKKDIFVKYPLQTCKGY